MYCYCRAKNILCLRSFYYFFLCTRHVQICTPVNIRMLTLNTYTEVFSTNVNSTEYHARFFLKYAKDVANLALVNAQILILYTHTLYFTPITFVIKSTNNCLITKPAYSRMKIVILPDTIRADRMNGSWSPNDTILTDLTNDKTNCISTREGKRNLEYIRPLFCH